MPPRRRGEAIKRGECGCVRSRGARGRLSGDQAAQHQQIDQQITPGFFRQRLFQERRVDGNFAVDEGLDRIVNIAQKRLHP